MRLALVTLVMLMTALACGGGGGMQETGPMTPNTLTRSERDAGFQLLFDGRTTNGWRGYSRQDMPAGWQVVDGALTRVAEAGDIITTSQHGDFELRLEWQISPGGNSGIFFRVVEQPGKGVYDSGPEFQVLDNAGHADGQKPETSAGSNFGLHAPTTDATRPVGEWNEARIVARGNYVEHWLNGQKIVVYVIGSQDWEDRVRESKFEAWESYGRAPSGHIALQDHGDRVAYRSIRIRSL